MFIGSSATGADTVDMPHYEKSAKVSSLLRCAVKRFLNVTKQRYAPKVTGTTPYSSRTSRRSHAAIAK